MATPAAVGVVLLGSDFKALSAVRSLHRIGVPAVLVDDRPRAAWYSRHVRSRHRHPGPMCGPGLTRFLVDLASRRGLEGWVLLPVQDDALRTVAEAHAELATAFRLVTPSWPRLRAVHDKLLLLDIAAAAGVPHPRTWCPDVEEELRSMEVVFPAIVKPRMSIALQRALGLKAIRVHDRAELVDAFRVARAADPEQAPIVQELVPGGGACQLSVACFCVEGSMVAAMTARRLRQYPPDLGLGSSLVEAVEIPGLVEPAARVLRRSCLSGMVEVEFKQDPRDGLVKLLDVNVRPWGWLGLCAASGIDFTVMQYRWAMGARPQACRASYGRTWVRPVTDVPAAAREIRAGSLTLRAYLRSMRGPLVFSVLDVRDPLPLVGDLASVMARTVRLAVRGVGV